MMARQDTAPQQQSAPPRKSGLFTTLLWELPWKVIGILLASLLVSLMIEYVGMTLIWPEEGAEHSRQVMLTESRYLAENFRQSLLHAEPVVLVSEWVWQGYTWVFVDSGFIGWMEQARQPRSGSGLLSTFQRLGSGIAAWLWEYLQATVWVTVVFFIRLCILVLSAPLFLMVTVVGVVEGLVRRDLRRYGAGYESSFLYHHAKRFIKPTLYGPCMLYLAWPTAVWPNLLLLPTAIMVGGILTVVTATFKKYL